jgi:hypothetical protein
MLVLIYGGEIVCVRYLNMALVGKERKEKMDKNDAEKPTIARTAYDLQRLKLEKLMKNPVCMQLVCCLL